jgi:hypothetical protein
MEMVGEIAMKEKVMHMMTRRERDGMDGRGAPCDEREVYINAACEM